jgi:hypothetical protein
LTAASEAEKIVKAISAMAMPRATRSPVGRLAAGGEMAVLPNVAGGPGPKQIARRW